MEQAKIVMISVGVQLLLLLFRESCCSKFNLILNFGAQKSTLFVGKVHNKLSGAKLT